MDSEFKKKTLINGLYLEKQSSLKLEEQAKSCVWGEFIHNNLSL